MNVVCKHLTVHGLVQGVYYRASMVQAAERLGVRGWVRNRRDGTVEALAEGDASAVDEFVTWAHQGPPAARVARVESTDLPAPAVPAQGFAQRDTA
ncbi:acylphosphatase [Xylophilus sp. GW821-FHT01B05]